MTDQQGKTLEEMAEEMAEKYTNGRNATQATVTLIDTAGYVTGYRLVTDKKKRDFLEDGELDENGLMEAVEDELDALHTLLGRYAEGESMESLRARFLSGVADALMDTLLEGVFKEAAGA